MSAHFKIGAHTTSIAQYMHHTFIRWGCQPLETVKTVWPSGLRRWLRAPFRKGVGSNPTAVIFHRRTYISYNTSAYAKHFAKIEFESMIMSFPSWHKGHHTQCYMSSKNTLAYITWMPGWVGLVLGRDFNSRGMETCRGSIPPLRRWDLYLEQKTPEVNSGAWFRSTDLWVMSPTR
jgi:hypothetical protein